MFNIREDYLLILKKKMFKKNYVKRDGGFLRGGLRN